MTVLGETVGGRFCPFVFPPHSLPKGRAKARPYNDSQRARPKQGHPPRQVPLLDLSLFSFLSLLLSANC